ncbi:MAG: transposase [Lewinellaceae bacterium]|nr:transposase [Lewinellaceae bacterium]
MTDWARQMLLQLHRWHPNRSIIIVADSSYSVLELLDAVRSKVCLITRLRLDAALYEPPEPKAKGKRGPHRKKAFVCQHYKK